MGTYCFWGWRRRSSWGRPASPAPCPHPRPPPARGRRAPPAPPPASAVGSGGSFGCRHRSAPDGEARAGPSGSELSLPPGLGGEIWRRGYPPWRGIGQRGPCWHPSHARGARSQAGSAGVGDMRETTPKDAI